jgi:lactoylglutathione lyase
MIQKKELETMKFLWVTLSVSNMEESLKFYQEIVGLPIAKRFSGEGMGEMAFLGEGETKLELIAHPSKPENHYGREMSIGFEVKSVDQMIRLIREKGLTVESGPFEPNPHVRFFFVKDPNGIRVQFVENR